MGLAAEKMPLPEEEAKGPLSEATEKKLSWAEDDAVAEVSAEDMTEHAVREKDETEEALDELRRIGWTKEAQKRDAAAKAKRKAETEFKHLEASEKLGKTDRLPDMTDQTTFADPTEQAAHEKMKAQMLQARKDIFERNVAKRQEEEAMEAVAELEAEQEKEKPQAKKKGFLSRLFGRK